MDQLWQKLNVERILTDVVAFLPNFLAGIAVFVASWIVFRLLRRPAHSVLRHSGVHDQLVELLIDKILRYTVLLLGLIMALDQLGFSVGTALAGLGVAGIAVGFAAQDSLANLISGILIFLDKPFRVGDWITTEDQYGRVTDITLRTTRIRTPRNTYVVIPNRNIIDAVLENHTKKGELRVDVPLGIAYKENIREARKVLLETAEKIEGVREDPKPDVVVSELGDSSVNMKVRVWIDSADKQRRTFYATLEACKLALDEAGIEIPFPHMQLFVDQVESRVWEGAAQNLLSLKSSAKAS